MSLFASLATAARALDAQRYGLDVVGQNIANVNTPGYARRTVDLAAVPPEAPGRAGRGVDAVGVRALRDRLLERRLQQELPAERREAAVASALSVVEVTLGPPGSSIDAQLQRFFDAFARLADAPTAVAARQAVVLEGQALAGAFRAVAGQLEASRRDLDRQVRGTVDEINALAARIAALNDAIDRAVPEALLHIQDEQARVVQELSELVDVDVLERAGGSLDVQIGNGRSLVVGPVAYTIEVASQAPGGYGDLSLEGVAITGEIAGGRLGGLLCVRDLNIVNYVVQLDALAFEVASRVNAYHAAGYTLDGMAAGAFFEFSPALSGTSGAARAITVESTIVTNPRLVAASATPDTGGNDVARRIAALGSAQTTDGAVSLVQMWSDLVYRVGHDARRATEESASRQEIVRQVAHLRDEVSGVSLDEEAMQMLKFQRAYEANARYFRVIDQALDRLLQLIG